VLIGAVLVVGALAFKFLSGGSGADTAVDSPPAISAPAASTNPAAAPAAAAAAPDAPAGPAPNTTRDPFKPLR
jgi:hypothetical protein